MEKKLIVTWLGHSCFKIQYGDYTMVIDPYKDRMVPGLSPLRVEADEVFTSHNHDDHGYVQAVTLRKPAAPSPFKVTKVRCHHDEVDGKKRGHNDIHVFEGEGLRFAHFGDIGEELDWQQMEELKSLDVAMIPVGGFFTIGPPEAKALIAQIRPRVVIPMHYRTEDFGFDAIADIRDFITLCDDVKKYDSDTIEVTKETEKQTALLKYGK
ncbi:MAG TPA: MBL fold metallo-hydrolase [Clostridiaceae bacterium]|nr:MBL fold metallo-hydrolase [Clostridiaceae bacterium]